MKNRLDLVKKISEAAQKFEREINIMEICGTHTQSIYRYGIRDILPENIKLISGPGCPVCVTDIYDIDYMLQASALPDVHICCYGDMLRVPGTSGSLSKISAQFGNVHVVTSALEALDIAKALPDKTVVFWAVGFETTTPMTAVAIKRAAQSDIGNFKVLCQHKTMPEVLSVILSQENKIDALICPGHVAVITGEAPFEKLPLPAVISGFEEDEILCSISLLLQMLSDDSCGFVNNYKSYVQGEGNTHARQLISDVFVKTSARWRGMGIIADSGLRINDCYNQFDAELFFGKFSFESKQNEFCLCSEIIKGNKTPADCQYFDKVCNPQKPLGPCMVSSEGACAAYYKYGRKF